MGARSMRAIWKIWGVGEYTGAGVAGGKLESWMWKAGRYSRTSLLASFGIRVAG